jgi:hypothetical protein
LSAALVLCCAALGGCGKKGPPLAPIVHIPAAVDKLSAQRVGNDVYLTLTIPTQNIDASTPADVSRIDIFGATSLTPPPVARIFEIATKVASVDVQPPAPPAGTEAATPPTVRPDLPAQGAQVTVRDRLTTDALMPKELAPRQTGNRTTPPAAPAAPSAAMMPHRFYVAVASSDQGRTGPPGTLIDIPLAPLPDPPPAAAVTATDDNLVISWEPSGGVLGFLLATPLLPEDSPLDELPEALESTRAAVPTPSGPTLYNIYREPADTDAPRAEESPSPVPGRPTPPAPLNAAPIDALTYADASPFDYGVERCYSVRAVRGTGANAIIGEPSPRACVTPVDTTAPAAPTGLAALGAEGVINLSWEPNGEADLGGYLVLRGRAGDATLQPVTAAPVMDTRYADRDVVPGVRYVYAVQAIDTQNPPNVSDESNRAEETAR